MALEPTTDQRDLRAAVRDFCTGTDGADTDRTWRGLVELGLTEIPFPEELGGAGSSLADTAVVVSELGRALSPAPYLHTVVAALTLSEAADASPDELRDLISGTRTAALVDAPDGHDPGTTVLTGTRRTVPGADRADLLVVVLDGGARVVAVDARDERVVVTPLPSLDSTRPLSRVTFHDVPVPAGTARASLRRARAAARTLIAAEQVGAARRCVELSVEYAVTRRQFGRPIGSFQAVKHRIVDMHVEVELAEAAVLGALEALDASGTDPVETDMASHVAAATASTAFVFAAAEAIQVHGGIGFTWEYPLHRFFRRARATEALHGGPAFHHRAVTSLAVG